MSLELRFVQFRINVCLRLSKNLNSPIRYAEESLGVISFEIVLTYITWKRKSKGWTHKVKKKPQKLEES